MNLQETELRGIKTSLLNAIQQGHLNSRNSVDFWGHYARKGLRIAPTSLLKIRWFTYNRNRYVIARSELHQRIESSKPPIVLYKRAKI